MSPRRRIAVLPVVVSLIAAGCDRAPTESDWPPLPPNFSVVDYELIDELQSFNNGIADRRRQVITNADEWAAFWEEFEAGREPRSDPPPVDFTTHVVLVAAMGGRPTGGYSISIEGVFEAQDRLTVRVLERSPGSSCIVTQAATRPVTGVRVPRVATDAEFVDKTETVDCSQ